MAPQQASQARRGIQEDLVSGFWHLGRAVAVTIRGASKVGGDILDQASAQGHVQHLLTPADAQDRDVLGPGFPDQRDLQGVPLLIHFRGGMEGFPGVPAPRVDIAPPREQEAHCALQGSLGVVRADNFQFPIPALGLQGGHIGALHTEPVSAGHKDT